MLDNLRDEAGQSPFFQEEESPQPEEQSKSLFLGLTPVQRFVLALMLFLMTCVLGAFCLLITEKIVPTFL